MIRASAFLRLTRRYGAIVALMLCAHSPTAILARAEELRPLCPDRPGKGTSACTLDAGHFQLEVDTFDGSFQRSGGIASDIYVMASTTLKYGLTDSTDIEAGFSPYLSQRTHGAGSDITIEGNGDLYLRGKWNFLGDGRHFAAVIEPFLKAATATIGLGNGATEGGIVLPLSYDLGGNWSASSTPELDLLLNQSGTGHHAAATDVVGLGRTLDDGLSLGVELWTAQNFDPAGTVSQYSFDSNLAWQPASFSDLQFDGGINLGLNRNTPGAQIYAGFSQRI